MCQGRLLAPAFRTSLLHFAPYEAAPLGGATSRDWATWWHIWVKSERAGIFVDSFARLGMESSRLQRVHCGGRTILAAEHTGCPHALRASASPVPWPCGFLPAPPLFVCPAGRPVTGGAICAAALGRHREWFRPRSAAGRVSCAPWV